MEPPRLATNEQAVGRRYAIAGLNVLTTRTLLLTIDPLAALAQTQEQIHQRLQEITPTTDPDLQALWEATANQFLDPSPKSNAKRNKPDPAITEQFLVLITCRNEKQQLELLGRLQEEGRQSKAL